MAGLQRFLRFFFFSATCEKIASYGFHWARTLLFPFRLAFLLLLFHCCGRR